MVLHVGTPVWILHLTSFSIPLPYRSKLNIVFVGYCSPPLVFRRLRNTSPRNRLRNSLEKLGCRQPSGARAETEPRRMRIKMISRQKESFIVLFLLLVDCMRPLISQTEFYPPNLFFCPPQRDSLVELSEGECWAGRRCCYYEARRPARLALRNENDITLFIDGSSSSWPALAPV